MTTNVKTSAPWRASAWALTAILAVGLLLRIAFIGGSGFNVDIQTFVAWTGTLLDHGLGNFYASAKFVDYPPGYFYVLAILGHMWAPFRHGDTSFAIIRILVKTPAILADLGIGIVLYAIARRFADERVALLTAALYVLNPAVIFISAYWGQVDSVAGFFALLAAYFLLRDAPSRTPWIPLAWISLACSLLIKPQAALVIPAFIAFAFADPSMRPRRLAQTGIGILAALFVSYLAALPFYPALNPFAVMVWLIERYAHGSNIYKVNSVNAFNLWAIKGSFWQSDALPILGIPQYLWGMALVAAAAALIVWRYVTDRTVNLLEACALSLLAFFMLATRMHERYSFNGLVFIIACVPFAKRYLWAAIVLSVMLFANLTYSLQYLAATSGHLTGVNQFNLWGPMTTFWALVSVATFFFLGYQYLGTNDDKEAQAPAPQPKAEAESPLAQWWAKGRSAFDPTEGFSVLSALDYVVMSAFGLFNIALSAIHYWLPTNKGSCWTVAGQTRCGVFDEIYYARAASEYLHNMRIYENTQPPLSKLLITFSTILFGGLQHGNTAVGWRFFQVIFGGLVVMALFALAKRVTRSTLFASLAALFLTADGMHYVQSRIATPEGLYVLFSVFAVYALYRFAIASQTSRRHRDAVSLPALAAAAAASLVGGVLTVAVWDLIWTHMTPPGKLTPAASIVVTLYVACGLYLLARYVVLPRMFPADGDEISFADGSYAVIRSDGTALYTPDGGALESAKGKPKVRIGDYSRNKGGTLVYEREGLRIEYGSEPRVEIEGSGRAAVFENAEIRAGAHVERGNSARFWLIAFAVAQGLFISTKWNGVTGLGFSFIAVAAIWLQQRFAARTPAQWGNPRGFRLDGVLLGILFTCATVYALAWTPDLIRQSPDPYEIHNFNDVVYRQYGMYEYHATLHAKHPYSSKAWEWPFDYVPIAYYYQDHRANTNDPNGCCVAEITSMPNPITAWLGLLAIPIVAVLAWKLRRKSYALIVLVYLLQWAPWLLSPRIDFMYEYYVDIPMTCLCIAIVLAHIWRWGRNAGGQSRTWSIAAVAGVSLAIVGAFIFFFPILSAMPITWNAWHARMWIPTWIIGPG